MATGRPETWPPWWRTVLRHRDRPRAGAVESTVSDEEWVDANATALTRNPKRWLRMLLRVLQGEKFPGDTPESALATLANPAAAIEIHPMLLLPHETVIDEAKWVAANENRRGTRSQAVAVQPAQRPRR